MVSTNAVRNVIYCCLFLSLITMSYSIYKKGAVEGFSPNPYKFIVLTCALWVYSGIILFLIEREDIIDRGDVQVVYNGIVDPDDLLLIVLVFILYLIAATKKQRWVVGIDCWEIKNGLLLKLISFLLKLIFVILISLMGARNTSSNLGGIKAIHFHFLYECSHVTSYTRFIRFIRQRVLSTCPLRLSVLGFLNAFCWLTYGLLFFDLFNLISNGTGCACGIIQLSVYAYYCFKYPQSKNIKIVDMILI
ncbi:hypothetical protein MKX01_009525 [Papaver californicum]|nr:hypothetical protein MKX01_009525 [Papaver californicum]